MPNLLVDPRRVAIAIAMLLILFFACARAPEDSSPAPSEMVTAQRLWALLINGGGRREINYYSHLDHLRSLLLLLEATGVEPGHIAIFSGDGADPEPDLATREGESPSGFWLLPSSMARHLRPPIDYRNSEIEGFTLQPATGERLREWFEGPGRRLDAGDTLLFYVTDHGSRKTEDLMENTVTLWGEELSVVELRGLFQLLDPGVRVVLFMSQCYSGAFVHSIFPEESERLPEGNACGYFSVPGDRKAYGCYAEVSRRKNVGHSHRMFEALAQRGRLPQAQREVLVTDRTPDVPLTSSSFFLDRRLEREALRTDREASAFVDELLEEAWADPWEWAEEIATLDRVSETFGLSSPRSIAELEEQTRSLPQLIALLRTYRRRWEGTLDNLRVENLRRFQETFPEWKERLEPAVLEELDPEARHDEANALLEALVSFTENEPEQAARLRDLHRKSKEARAIGYRAEVRLAASLRLRALLSEVAGRLYVTRYAAIEERSALARLESCEDLELGGRAPASRLPTFELAEPFPTLAQERKRLESVMPGWIGIRYRPLREEEREGDALPRGAVVVVAVLPDSPAAKAELRDSDILLGPPEAPFVEPHAVREWIMQNDPGERVALQILRDGREQQVTIRLGSYPLGTRE